MEGRSETLRPELGRYYQNWANYVTSSMGQRMNHNIRQNEINSNVKANYLSYIRIIISKLNQ